MTAALLVFAKSPVPGRSKTRLCPPCTPREAARLAEAALACTLAAAARAPAPRRVVVLDGEPDGWLPRGFEVIPQRGNSMDERLAAAFADAGGPALLIGMDTPQVSPQLLSSALAALAEPGVDAVLGKAADGGWWALGLRRPDPAALLGVPMSTSATGSEQERRLRALGLRVRELPVLRDVDVIADAEEVAAAIPSSPFARVLESVRFGAGPR